jgi:hypothetical protein
MLAIAIAISRRITSNPTDSTFRINQVEYKLDSDVTRFFLSIVSSLKFIGKTPWSTGGEFVVRRRLHYLPQIEQNCL